MKKIALWEANHPKTALKNGDNVILSIIGENAKKLESDILNTFNMAIPSIST